MSTGSAPVSKTVAIYIDNSAAIYSAQKLQEQVDKITASIKKGEAAGKDMTAQYEKLGKTKDQLSQVQAILDGKMAPTMKMLKDQVNALHKELENMSKDAPGYAQKLESFKNASNALKDMKDHVAGVRQQMEETNTDKGLFSWFKLLVGGNLIASNLQIALSKLKDFADESSRLAAEQEGVKRAFDRLNQPNLLDNLREATKGTVSDLDLMKQAVQFNNFKLPLDKLATALEFARRRAADTGVSVDYLVESIVTGIGRQSPLILDNLGISAKAVSEEFKRTGNFAQAAFNIIHEETLKAGADLETYAQEEARLNAMIANRQAELGKYINMLKGYGIALAKDFSVNFGNNESEVDKYLDTLNRVEAASAEAVKAGDNANMLFLQNFKTFSDQYAAADLKGREKIKQQAEALHRTLSANAAQYYKNDTQQLRFYLNSLAQAYASLTGQFQKTPVNLQTLQPGDVKGMSKEQLSALQENIGNAEGSLTSTDKKTVLHYRALKKAIQTELDKITGTFYDNQDKEREARFKKEQKATEEHYKKIEEQIAKGPQIYPDLSPQRDDMSTMPGLNDYQQATLKGAEANWNRLQGLHRKEEQETKQHYRKMVQLAEDYLGSAQNALNAFADWQNQRDQAELDRDKAINDRKLQNLQDQLNAKRISQAQYDREVKKANDALAKQQDEVNRRNFERNQKIQLANAAINAAKGITAIWGEYAAQPYVAAILTAVEVAATGFQAAQIKKQKYPGYAKGGFTGVPDGPSHAAGGINMIDGRTGRTIGQMEGGEPIISRDTYRNNKAIVDALIQSGQHGNGAAIDWHRQQLAGINTAMLQQSMAYNRMYATGGFVPTGTGPAAMGNSKDLLDAINKLNAHLSKDIRAKVVWTDIRDANNTIDLLKKASSVR